MGLAEKVRTHEQHSIMKNVLDNTPADADPSLGVGFGGSRVEPILVHRTYLNIIHDSKPKSAR